MAAREEAGLLVPAEDEDQVLGLGSEVGFMKVVARRFAIGLHVEFDAVDLFSIEECQGAVARALEIVGPLRGFAVCGSFRLRQPPLCDVLACALAALGVGRECWENEVERD